MIKYNTLQIKTRQPYSTTLETLEFTPSVISAWVEVGVNFNGLRNKVSWDE